MTPPRWKATSPPAGLALELLRELLHLPAARAQRDRDPANDRRRRGPSTLAVVADRGVGDPRLSGNLPEAGSGVVEHFGEHGACPMCPQFGGKPLAPQGSLLG